MSFLSNFAPEPKCVMSTTNSQAMKVIPFGPNGGATVTGVDIHHLDTTQLQDLYDALTKHRVLVLPDIHLTQEQQLTFTRRWCETLGAPTGNLRIREITNQGTFGDYQLDWHADGYFNKTGPKIGILNGITVPSQPVNTRFCDMIRLLADVPKDIRAELNGKWICNDAVKTQYGRLRGEAPTSEDFREWPHVEHPIIHREATTRQEALYLGARKWSWIKDMEPGRSDEILAFLWNMVDSDRYSFEGSWKKGMLTVWHNELVLHFKPQGNGEPRLLDRTSVPGEALIMACRFPEIETAEEERNNMELRA